LAWLPDSPGLLPGTDQPGLVGADHGLQPVADSSEAPGQYVRDVSAHHTAFVAGSVVLSIGAFLLIAISPRHNQIPVSASG
jgi:hypothetical protein